MILSKNYILLLAMIIVWWNAGRPRSGALCSEMRRSSLMFKYAFRQCYQNEKSIRADQYVKSLMNKDMT